jgi:Predicted secreted protein
MREDKRKRIIAIIAHCILNQNTVVKPLASHEGAVKNLANLLVDLGYGIIQLPCPETIYLGLKRWWMSREQYDTQSYREFSRKLLKPYIHLLRELVKDKCKYILVGVRGSPSCALKTTTSNPDWFGEPAASVLPPSSKIDSPGVFMSELLELIKEHRLPEPLLVIDISHDEVAKQGVPVEIVKQLTMIAKNRDQAYQSL